MVLRRYSGTLASKLSLPDLILVDGGIGQVRAAQKALRESKTDIAVVSLAKKEEKIYFPEKRALSLPRRSPALQLLQRARDEAHRFALAYHRLRRKKKLFGS